MDFNSLYGKVLTTEKYYPYLQKAQRGQKEIWIWQQVYCEQSGDKNSLSSVQKTIMCVQLE